MNKPRTSSTMIKNLKNLSLLVFSAAVFVGCGSAQDSELKNEIDADNIAPFVETVSPSSIKNEEIALNEKAIIITFSEAISQNSVDLLNSQEIRSMNSKEVLLKGTWDFNGDKNNELIFKFPENQTLLPNEKFSINLSNKITDQAGNALGFAQNSTITFSTPKLFDISITASGLTTGDTVKITQKYIKSGKINDSKSAITVVLSNDASSGLIDSNLSASEEFLLTVSEQPANKFCTLTAAYGKIVNSQNASADLNCQSVVPYYDVTPNWNDYISIDTNKLSVHGGELRSFTVPELTSCNGATASDELNVFNWSCEEINSNDSIQIRIYSTGLKDDKGLSDLINFSETPEWKQNKIIVSDAAGPVSTTKRAIWWNNPILATTPDIEKLYLEGAIYVHLGNNDPTIGYTKQAFELSKDHIALLIDPDKELYTKSGGIKVGTSSNSINYFWMEGTFNANDSDIGIDLNNAHYGRLNNLTLKNAEHDGITLLKSNWTQLTNVTVTNSGLDGLVIRNSESLGFGVNVTNSTFNYNNGSGVRIDSAKTNLLNINASNNKGNGLVIEAPNNTVSGANLSNNIENGLIISGTQNNLLSSLTIANNNGYGIFLDQDSTGKNNPRTNAVISSTVANNKLSAIHFNEEINDQAIIDSNKIINILDAYNSPSSCNQCNNMTTITTNDEAIDSVFTAVTSDAGVNNYVSNPGMPSSEIKSYSKLANSFRNWGLKNELSETEGSGSCITEVYCKIYDWSLNAADTLLLNNLSEPVNYASFSLTSDTSLTINYLENSIEINSDTIGNNNGFCEENETCLLVSNNGSYQGHGALSIYNDTNNIWTDSGITLQKYETNGY